MRSSLHSFMHAASRKSEGLKSYRPERVLREARMPPGIYRSSGKFWYHELAELPPQLRSAMGAPDPNVAVRIRRRMGLRSGSSQAIMIKRHELSLLGIGEEVLRIWTQPLADDLFLERCRLLARFIPAPTFESACDGHGLRSSWIEGVPARECTPDERVELVRSLLQGMQRLAAATSEPDRIDFVDQVLSAGKRSAEHRTAFQQISTDPRAAALRGLPLTLQHGDPGIQNILVRPGAEPILVDWTPFTLGIRPFWSDAAHLVGIDSHQPLLRGAFDAELTGLWTAVGAEAPEVRQLRDTMQFAEVLFCAMLGLGKGESQQVQHLRSGRPVEATSKPEKAMRVLAAMDQATGR